MTGIAKSYITGLAEPNMTGLSESFMTGLAESEMTRLAESDLTGLAVVPDSNTSVGEEMVLRCEELAVSEYREPLYIQTYQHNIDNTVKKDQIFTDL